MVATEGKDNIQNEQPEPIFDNPFKIEDITVFDETTLRDMLSNGSFGLNVPDLALSLHDMGEPLVQRVRRVLPRSRQRSFMKNLGKPASPQEIQAARQHILDNLFWELTYWKTPELYEELTEGEKLHPEIFRQLSPDLKDKVVLDAGAGSGRASFECLRFGAKEVHAVDPSPGLLKILKQKLHQSPNGRQIVAHPGRFDNLPLDDSSVDVAISCSAFTAEPEQGGEPGLEELKRVTKPGGKIVIIWPRAQDHEWLTKHGFKRIVLPIRHEMKVRFRSLQSAMQCARRFYTKNRAVVEYLLKHGRPEIPFSVLGFNPPNDYCVYSNPLRRKNSWSKAS